MSSREMKKTVQSVQVLSFIQDSLQVKNIIAKLKKEALSSLLKIYIKHLYYWSVAHLATKDAKEGIIQVPNMNLTQG